jgi:hypothetical protein
MRVPRRGSARRGTAKVLFLKLVYKPLNHKAFPLLAKIDVQKWKRVKKQLQALCGSENMVAIG